MKIRKLRKEELPPIDLLLVADPSHTHIEEYVRRGECFVAEEFNRIIGAYVLLPTRPETVELINISVIEDQQGKGIGKKLVFHAIDMASEQGFKTMEIGTGNSSIAQLALYQKCGFRIIGVDINFFIHHYKEEIFENDIQCRDMIRLSKEL